MYYVAYVPFSFHGQGGLAGVNDSGDLAGARNGTTQQRLLSFGMSLEERHGSYQGSFRIEGGRILIDASGTQFSGVEGELYRLNDFTERQLSVLRALDDPSGPSDYPASDPDGLCLDLPSPKSLVDDLSSSSEEPAVDVALDGGSRVQRYLETFLRQYQRRTQAERAVICTRLASSKDSTRKHVARALERFPDGRFRPSDLLWLVVTGGATLVGAWMAWSQMTSPDGLSTTAMLGILLFTALAGVVFVVLVAAILRQRIALRQLRSAVTA